MKKFIYLIIPFTLLTGQVKLSSVLVADGFKKPIYVTSHPEDSKLLYVLEQAGRIMLIAVSYTHLTLPTILLV